MQQERNSAENEHEIAVGRKQQVETLEAEVARLMADVGGLTGAKDSAETDINLLKAQIDKLEAEKAQISAEKSQIADISEQHKFESRASSKETELAAQKLEELEAQFAAEKATLEKKNLELEAQFASETAALEKKNLSDWEDYEAQLAKNKEEFKHQKQQLIEKTEKQLEQAVAQLKEREASAEMIVIQGKEKELEWQERWKQLEGEEVRMRELRGKNDAMEGSSRAGDGVCQ